MKNILIIFLCLLMSGCISLSKTRNLENQIVLLQESISRRDEEIIKKDKEIANLQGLLQQKDDKIKELNQKLEMFGVFDK